jgi:hypothetical protein
VTRSDLLDFFGPLLDLAATLAGVVAGAWLAAGVARLLPGRK